MAGGEDGEAEQVEEGVEGCRDDVCSVQGGGVFGRERFVCFLTGVSRGLMRNMG